MPFESEVGGLNAGVDGDLSKEEVVEGLEEKGFGGKAIEFYDGFSDWTGEPISFMVSSRDPLFQRGLSGRDRLMAYMPPNPSDLGGFEEFDDPEWPEYPVANQINPFIDTEKLEEIREESEFPRHVIYVSSSRGFNEEVRDFLKDSDFYTLTNPLELRPKLYDKGRFAEWADENEQPVLPTEDLGRVHLNGKEWTEDRLGRTDRLILKKNRSAGGKHVWEVDYDRIRELGEENEIQEPGTGYIVQPLIPHEVDKRLKLIHGVDAAENRTGSPDMIQCNLSTATDEFREEELKAMKVYAFDLAEPLALEESSGNPVLEEEARAIGNELYADLVEDFADPDLPEPNIVASADVMKTSKENIEFLPEEYLDRMPYDEEGNVYFLNEAGNSSGSIMDRLYLWERMPERVPSINLTRKLRKVAGYETMPPEQHVNNISSRIWNRIGSQYESPNEINDLCEEYIEEGILEPVEE